MNKFTKHTVVAVLIVLSVVIWGFGSSSNIEGMYYQKRYDFTGTNSLYIELEPELKFNWITQDVEKGFYELSTADREIIDSGHTDAARVHSVKIDERLNKDMIFTFGGSGSDKTRIRLRKPQADLKTTYKIVDTIYVVGDVHGKYDELIKLLKASKIIDEDLKWTAGTAHLVFLGDLFDRGDQVTKLLWFIYGLEEQAEEVKGKVHLVLGNHEIMVMSKDLRYVSAKEKNIAIGHKVSYDQLFHPSNSLLGSWLSGKPSVIKIDQYLFAHGGIVDLGTNTLYKYNEIVAGLIQDPIFLEITRRAPDSTKYDAERWYQLRDFFYYENGPFWYRGYVQSDTLGEQLTQMLKRYKSRVHIVAHTRQETITKKYDGRLLTTDLYDEATELLLITKNKKNYSTFKMDDEGHVSPLD